MLNGAIILFTFIVHLSSAVSDCEIIAEFGLQYSDAAQCMGWTDNITQDPVNWCCDDDDVPGILCDQGRVLKIELSTGGIKGKIPVSFSKLSLLRTFISIDNDFSTIEGLPQSLHSLSIAYAPHLNNSFLGIVSKLSNLTFLQIFDVPCKDASLSFLTNLTQLTKLSVSESQITGSFSYLRKLTQLNTLYLPLNYLTSTARLTDLSGLTSLTDLRLNDNPLNQTLDALRPLSNMESLFMQDTRAWGTLDNLETMKVLTDLRLSSNHLSGTLKGLSKMTHLTNLSAFGNSFTGNLSPLQKLTLLQFVELTGNALTGGVNPLSKMTDLEFLNLSKNKLNGTIDALKNLTKLVVLALTANHFSGNVNALAKATSIESLSLDVNHFEGSVRVVGNMDKLAQLWLSNNSFDGGLEALSGLLQLGYANLDNNHFSAGLEGFVSPQLSILDITNNYFSGPFPSIPRLTHYALQPIALLITGNSWTCPYPVFQARVAVDRDNCLQDSAVIIYVTLAAVLITGLFAVYFCYFKKRVVQRTTSTRRLALILWLINYIPRPIILTTDVLFFNAIITTHYQDVPVCDLLNLQEVFSLVVPFWPYDALPPTNTFAEYIRVLQKLIPNSLFVTGSITVFKEFCNEFTGCGYASSAMQCDIAPASVDYFFVLLITFIALRVCKELIRVGIILFALHRKKIPALTLQFVSISIFSPVLLFLPSFVDDELLSLTSAKEWLVILLTEVFLHSFPQLALGFYYYFYVVQTGLDWTVIVSVGVTITSVGVRLVQSIAALRLTDLSRASMFKDYRGRMGTVNAESARLPLTQSFSRLEDVS